MKTLNRSHQAELSKKQLLRKYSAIRLLEEVEPHEKGIKQICHDLKRCYFLVNGKVPFELRQAVIDIENDENLTGIEKKRKIYQKVRFFFMGEFPEHYEQILKFYSQRQSTATFGFVAHAINDEQYPEQYVLPYQSPSPENGLAPNSDDVLVDICLEKGKAYYKAKMEKVKLKDPKSVSDQDENKLVDAGAKAIFTFTSEGLRLEKLTFRNKATHKVVCSYINKQQKKEILDRHYKEYEEHIKKHAEAAFKNKFFKTFKENNGDIDAILKKLTNDQMKHLPLATLKYKYVKDIRVTLNGENKTIAQQLDDAKKQFHQYRSTFLADRDSAGKRLVKAVLSVLTVIPAIYNLFKKPSGKKLNNLHNVVHADDALTTRRNRQAAG